MENLVSVLAENSVHVVQFLFQNFDAWLTLKLMDICFILCVQSAFQKSFHLVAQNLSFGKIQIWNSYGRGTRIVCLRLNVTLCTKVKIECRLWHSKLDIHSFPMV